MIRSCRHLGFEKTFLSLDTAAHSAKCTDRKERCRGGGRESLSEAALAVWEEKRAVARSGGPGDGFAGVEGGGGLALPW